MTDSTDIKKEYYEQIYASKSLDEPQMKHTNSLKLPKLMQAETRLNNHISIK